ncbi:MFS transporter [Pseudomonas sp. RIT-PI-S]|uniref:MFS transporter n=1 Tax=Pseudomonas sp. RIT-PI-S TaxID=3035295 RepID=UPI0021D86FD6|nr:MFS transporter [Pseudomonas sp. RIT-PI-S]
MSPPPTPSTWAALRALPRITHWLLLGMAGARVASFMIWPFIAVAMNKRFGTPITEIGAQLAIGALVTIALSPLSGWLGDRFDARNLMLAGCALCMGGYALMGLLPSQSSYFVAIVVFAVAQSILEPLLRMLLSDTASSDAQRTFLFHIRYYLINCAAAIGPLLGLWFANCASDAVFAVAVCANLGLALVIANATRGRHARAAKVVSPPLATVFRALLGSKLLLTVIVMNFFLVLLYAQIDEPLTFYLLQLQVQDINHLIAMMSVTNAAVVLAVHLLLMPRLIALADKTAYLAALACMMVAHGIIAANVHAWWFGWLLAVMFATFAEIVVMPLFGTLVDRLAPPGMRGSFIGISMLAGLGSALSPWLGALAIAKVGGVGWFSLLAIACVPIGVLGYRALQGSQPQALAEPAP